MTKRILNVGHCAMDHQAIRSVVHRDFQADVVDSSTLDEALGRLRSEPFDLVLVNRIFDADQTEGLALIRAIQRDDALTDLPVMLVSNLDEHQQRAIEAGAEPGFGKRDLTTPETRRKLGRFLGSGPAGPDPPSHSSRPPD